MNNPFDEIIDRRGTDAIKVDHVKELWGRDDLLPLWIADMDFATPPFVLDALRRRLDHPVLGYTCRSQAWTDAITAWQQQRYGWTVSADWLYFVPGIVPGIAFAIQCFTKPGDKVLIQTPVYHPYIHVPQNNGRTVVMSDLVVREAVPGTVTPRLEVDWQRFERDVKGCKLFLLCHPHNPGGHVWSVEELQRMADICAREGVIVVSDEIHADLTLPGYHHHPFASVSDTAAQCSITFASPSKAFNIPGLTSSYSIIPNDALRERFHAYLGNNELSNGHLFAFQAVVAAYSHGTQWLDDCLGYIEDNIDYLWQTLHDTMPRITMMRPEASFLVFLDCRALTHRDGTPLTHDELLSFFADGARLALNDGAMFGTPGTGFMRLNVATPRAILAEALRRLKEAYDALD